MPYGRIEGEARERAQKELDAEFAKITDDELCCVACANARSKARRGGFGEGGKKIWRTMSCKKHRMMRQVTYNTSPLSETYWTS